MENAPYLTPKQAAAVIGYSPGALANMRNSGNGPRWTKPAGRVIYSRADLVAWVEGR